jgi:glycosyltransferase involved in cell wall biosynthesis
MNATAPCVSVIMPVYQVENYVAHAIQSVLDQSYKDFELIIVDDGGTDSSLAICQSFVDERIRIISQRNRGLAGARNTGIASVRGRYIALLDSDDVWFKEKLAVHVAHLNANLDIGVSYAGAELIDEGGGALGIRQRPKLGHVTAKDVFCGRAIPNGSTPAFRIEMLTDAVLHREPDGRAWYFDESLRRSEDIECWTRLALRSRLRFEAVNEALTYCRVNSKGLSADIIRQLSSWEQMCTSIATFAPEFVAQYRAEARARELRYLAWRCVFMRDRGLGIALIMEAISSFPRLLWQEPVQSFTTLLTCLAMRMLPQAGFTFFAGVTKRITRRSVY